MISSKVCRKCNILKNLDDFPREKHRSDGRMSRCKVCVNSINAEYRKRNADKVKASRRKYYVKTIDARRAEKRSYGAKNKDKKRSYDKLYREENAVKIAAYKRAWDISSRARPEIKLKRNLRRRINHAMRGHSKSGSTIELIGCSFEFFKDHIQSQFKEGMSWDNYGRWHIDHIIPCYTFNLVDPEQQKLCFHWSNQRPLWAIENLTRTRPNYHKIISSRTTRQ